MPQRQNENEQRSPVELLQFRNMYMTKGESQTVHHVLFSASSLVCGCAVINLIPHLLQVVTNFTSFNSIFEIMFSTELKYFITLWVCCTYCNGLTVSFCRMILVISPPRIHLKNTTCVLAQWHLSFIECAYLLGLMQALMSCILCKNYSGLPLTEMS